MFELLPGLCSILNFAGYSNLFQRPPVSMNVHLQPYKTRLYQIGDVGVFLLPFISMGHCTKLWSSHFVDKQVHNP